MPEQKDKEKIIIVGAGPAGYTAAIYAARAGLSPLMITGTLEGGQITETQELGNWPGEPEPITGFNLMDKMKKQAAGYGVRFQNDTVLAIARHDGAISLQCEKGTAEAEAVIISTGRVLGTGSLILRDLRRLLLPEEENRRNRRRQHRGA